MANISHSHKERFSSSMAPIGNSHQIKKWLSEVGNTPLMMTITELTRTCQRFRSPDTPLAISLQFRHSVVSHAFSIIVIYLFIKLFYLYGNQFLLLTCTPPQSACLAVSSASHHHPPRLGGINTRVNGIMLDDGRTY